MLYNAHNFMLTMLNMLNINIYVLISYRIPNSGVASFLVYCL